MTARRVALLLLAGGGLFGCSGNEGPQATTGTACVGGKCDAAEAETDAATDGDEDPFAGLPAGDDATFCEERRRDAFNANQLAFTETSLRWSCNDVDGVSAQWRGQEYCEYFAMVDLPAVGKSAGGVEFLGKPLGSSGTDGATPSGVTLTMEQVVALEERVDDVVGQCVFTSWNADVADPITCDGEPGCERPEVLGIPVDERFRMMFNNNTAEAALDLADECINTATDTPDPDDADDPLHDDFTRGCFHNGDLNETAWRKSDTIMCTALVKATECGCYPELDPILLPEEEGGTDTENEWYFPGFPEAFGDTSKRGFTLGAWSSIDELPAGCRHVEVPDGSHAIVTCDLTAANVLNGASEVKELCRAKYADNVVVHVPLSTDWITCSPPNWASCDAPPWALTP